MLCICFISIILGFFKRWFPNSEELFDKINQQITEMARKVNDMDTHLEETISENKQMKNRLEETLMLLDINNGTANTIVNPLQSTSVEEFCNCEKKCEVGNNGRLYCPCLRANRKCSEKCHTNVCRNK